MSWRDNDLQEHFGYSSPTIPAVGYGEVIRRLRGERRLSQPALAKLARLNVETIVRAEQNGNITTFKLTQIADALNTDLSDFFTGGRKSAAMKPPSVWSRLNAEQRAYLERVAKRMLQEAPDDGGV